jgi:hydroxymethylpyrimidine/phosphomethylpyrimidine kinase
MPKRKSLPIALTIAGSDSGGGAGIQADLKTFAALGVHGTSAITCVTAQNPKRVAGLQAIRPDIVRQQIEAVFEELPPAAVKTGMLYSAEIIRVVVQCFSRGNRPPLVVDPVMVSTSGENLLKPSAITILQDQLLPLAALVTPNLPEAEILVGRKLNSIDDLHDAAHEICRRFGCAVLVKGGHLRRAPVALDVFFDGRQDRLLVAPFVRGVSTHGTGCAYSAAIAGYLASGHSLLRAVELAKRFITQTIARSYLAGRHSVLNHFSR